MFSFQKSMMNCLNRHLLVKKWGILQTRMDQKRGGPKGNEFRLFLIFGMNVTNSSSERRRWKNWGHLPSFHVPCLRYSPKLSKNAFFVICAHLSKKFRYIEVIYIDASERPRCELSENGIAYYATTYCFGDIRDCGQRILINFCYVNIFFGILITNISWRWLRPL